MDLGTKFKNIRYNNNLSQEDLAKILKINRNYLSRIETNKSTPTAEVLFILANQFNLSIDSLLGINIDEKESTETRKDKIKKITTQCMHLSSAELDFILNMIYVMSTNSQL